MTLYELCERNILLVNILPYQQSPIAHAVGSIQDLRAGLCDWFDPRLGQLLYPHCEEEGVHGFCSVHPSCLSISNQKFSSHFSQQPCITVSHFKLGMVLLARGPTCRLLNSRQPVIYFLFYNLLYFQT